MAEQPSNQQVSIKLIGWRNRRGQFARADDELTERMQASTRGWLDVAGKLAAHESPIGNRARAAGDRRRRPPNTPRFRDSWQSSYKPGKGGAEAALTNVAPHAFAVIFPTRPHIITPKRARRLVFEPSGAGTGRFVFARRVRHPGTRGNDVPTRVLRAMDSWGQDELARVAGRMATWIADVFNDK